MAARRTHLPRQCTGDARFKLDLPPPQAGLKKKMGERGTLPPARGRSKGTPYLLPAIQDTTPDSDSIPTGYSAGLFHGTVDRRRSGDLPLRLRLRDHHVVLAVGGGQRRIPAGGIGLRIGGRARMG